MKLFEEISKYYRRLMVEPLLEEEEDPRDVVAQDLVTAIRTLKTFRGETWDMAFSGNLDRAHHQKEALSSFNLVYCYDQVIEDLEAWLDGE